MTENPSDRDLPSGPPYRVEVTVPKQYLKNLYRAYPLATYPELTSAPDVLRRAAADMARLRLREQERRRCDRCETDTATEANAEDRDPDVLPVVIVDEHGKPVGGYDPEEIKDSLEELDAAAENGELPSEVANYQ